MALLTDFLKDYMEVSTQRKLFMSSFFLVAALLLYAYLYSLVFLAVVALVLWYAYGHIDDATAAHIDPAGKYVFITGCDSGFGLDSAKALRDMGFHVIAGCYDEGSAGAKELKARPWVKKIEVVHLDVASETSVQAAVKEVKDICSDQGLWAVINNAGQNNIGPAELLPMTSYHKISEVNLFGAIRVIKGCLPLIRQAEGRIVNVTSERAYNHKPYSTSYCMTKAGLSAYSNCLRREMQQHNVKVIEVVPGEFAPATAICDSRLIEALRDPVLTEHTKLSLQDQEKAYPLEQIDALYQQLEPEKIAARFGQMTTGPVLRAYADALTREQPKHVYLVHGGARECLDPHIILLRLQPILPHCIAGSVERILFHFL